MSDQRQRQKYGSDDEDDDEPKHRRVPVSPPAQCPEFRAVRVQPRMNEDVVISSNLQRKAAPIGSRYAGAVSVVDKPSIIRMDDYIDKPAPDHATGQDRKRESLWCPRRLRQPPAFYPLEKSTRLVEDVDPPQVASRLADCLRTMSVQAVYDDETATASLFTGENVEMHLSLWKTPSHTRQQGVLVELQRRKGDSIAFHRYSRSILDAAMNDSDMDDVFPLGDILYSKKVQRLLAMELRNKEHQEHENAIIAIEIAHGLLMKDRIDATQLGLESLCLLTDPSKTGYVTAVLAAHVILLGSTDGVSIPGVTGEEQGPDYLKHVGPHREIRETILNLVQFQRLGESEECDHMNIEHEQNMRMDIDQEHMTLLHNLALAVLANSLDVIENAERFEDEPEDTKPAAKVRSKSSSDVTEEFMGLTKDTFDKDILSTLISEMSKAEKKPHNATLSAKCLGSLCRASDEARRKAKELDAKTVVQTALEVGERTHLKLETECKKVHNAITQQEEQDHV